MLMIVSTGIQMNILENGLLTPWERYSMWTSYDLHIGLCQYEQISQLKDHSISVDQARYATSIVAKYLDTSTVKVSNNFYKTTLPADMIFTKEDVYKSDEKIEKLTREYNTHYRAWIWSLIYLLSTRVDLSFAVHKLAKFSANPVKVHFEGLVHLLRYIRDMIC